MPPRKPGAWIAIGVALGAALFAATRNPVWIAVGTALGVALSARARRGAR
ncbi:MAG TPA: hypothetical protein VFE72_13145 [Lysobacter sp.]|nr:hypothetical protein [Lysobacter sp.]